MLLQSSHKQMCSAAKIVGELASNTMTWTLVDPHTLLKTVSLESICFSNMSF